MPSRPHRDAARRIARFLHRRIVVPVVATVLPTDCLGCGRDLGAVQHLGACAACWSSLRPLRPPLCDGCALPRPRGSDLDGPAGGRCASCVLSPWPRIEGVRSAVAYDDLARRFLLGAKLGGRRELLGPLGRHLAAALAVDGFVDGCAAVVAVPSHPWTLLRRGFNPARDLAASVARAAGLPRLRGVLVRRPSRGIASKRMGAAARRRAAAGAFLALRRVPVARILLVDDVLTTGSTVRACAAALAAAGARQVRVAAWARSLPEHPQG